MYDPDEFEAEARERKLRAQLNQLFHQFAGKVRTVWGAGRLLMSPACTNGIRCRRRLLFVVASQIEHVANRNRAPFPQGGFDMPERQYGFFGVAHREMVYLMPTTNCLVALVNSPVQHTRVWPPVAMSQTDPPLMRPAFRVDAR